MLFYKSCCISALCVIYRCYTPPPCSIHSEILRSPSGNTTLKGFKYELTTQRLLIRQYKFKTLEMLNSSIDPNIRPDFYSNVAF